MKKYICTALVLALASALLVGCGCANRNVSDDPNGMVTNPISGTAATNPMPTMTMPPQETTRETTHPTYETTRPTTAPPTAPEIPGETDGSEAPHPTDNFGGSATEGTRSRRIRGR